MEVFDDISDDDLDFVGFREYERRPYTVRQRRNPFEDYHETDFLFVSAYKSKLLLMF